MTSGVVRPVTQPPSGTLTWAPERPGDTADHGSNTAPAARPGHPAGKWSTT
jgi:hypothetical protein